MNIKKTQDRIDYLRDYVRQQCTPHEFDNDFRFLSFWLTELLDALPEEIVPPEERARNAELVFAIARIAEVADVSEWGMHKVHGSRARLEKKIASALETLYSEARPFLSAQLGLKHNEHLNALADALGMSWGDGGPTVNLPRLELSSIELAELVAEELTNAGLRLNANRQGVFVKTLEAIGKVSGFKTNAQRAAKAALYDTPIT